MDNPFFVKFIEAKSHVSEKFENFTFIVLLGFEDFGQVAVSQFHLDVELAVLHPSAVVANDVGVLTAHGKGAESIHFLDRLHHGIAVFGSIFISDLYSVLNAIQFVLSAHD